MTLDPEYWRGFWAWRKTQIPDKTEGKEIFTVSLVDGKYHGLKNPMAGGITWVRGDKLL